MALAVVFAMLPHTLSAMWMRQVIPLKSGWNAVCLKVNPVESACDTVFGSCDAIEVVSWWNRDRADDGTGNVAPGDFRNWYKDNVQPATFARAIGGERYLIKASAAATLTVVGVPARPDGRLYRGEKNLVGFNLDAAQTGTFYSEYFGPLAGASLLGVSWCYTVSEENESLLARVSGPVGSADQAVWIDVDGEGELNYMGPLEVTLDTSDAAISWTRSTVARTVTVKNVTDEPKVVTVGLDPSITPPEGQGTLAGLVALSAEEIDWSPGYARRVYRPVTFPIVTNLAAGATFELTLRPDVDRMAPSSGDYLGVLTVSDAGSTVKGTISAAGTVMHRIGVSAAGSLAEARNPTGLWVGSVVLSGVNRARMLTSAPSTEWREEDIEDAEGDFTFRLIVHVGEDGRARLLKEVYTGSDTEDNSVAALLADRATAKEYRRVHPQARIRRTSSANFPFMTPQLLTGGEFAVGGAKLGVTLTQLYDDRTNPFVHRFHPQHDNIEFINGVPRKISETSPSYESWTVVREIELEFLAADPTGGNDDWNRTVVGGIYREHVRGLNKTPIITEGAFRLTKVLDTPEVRQGVVH